MIPTLHYECLHRYVFAPDLFGQVHELAEDDSLPLLHDIERLFVVVVAFEDSHLQHGTVLADHEDLFDCLLC